MRRRLVVGATMVSGLCISCGGATNGPKPPSAEEHANAPQACQVAKDPLNPMVVEWPAMNRADLDSVSRRGLVVVSYAGCVMKVLTNCATAGSYEFTAATPVGDTLTIDDESKLYAELPLGVASLKGELAQGRKLQLAYVAVGQRVASQAPAQLSGDCRGATHWVQTMTVGAYALDTMASSAAGGNAEVGRVQGGAQERSARARRGSSGDLEGCRAVNPNREACNAILKLGLVELAPMAQNRISGSDSLQSPAMARIPGGTFMMGPKQSETTPVIQFDLHEERVEPFEIDVTEVTVAQYQECVKAKKCRAPDTDTSCNWGKPKRGNYPVNCVDWSQANAFCAWAGKRLPTEVQWEYAARGSDSRQNPWGDAPPPEDICWKQSVSCPVGTSPADSSPFGVKDMAGNVREWTANEACFTLQEGEDWNYCTFYTKESHCTAAHVVRGSSWDEQEFRAASHRSCAASTAQSQSIGFRCSR